MRLNLRRKIQNGACDQHQRAGGDEKKQDASLQVARALHEEDDKFVAWDAWVLC